MLATMSGSMRPIGTGVGGSVQGLLREARQTRGAARSFAHSAVRLDRSPSDHDGKPKVIFSGIQPTGVPHLGNYFGALRNWVDLQRTAKPQDELFFSIVGLHAMTAPFSPDELRRNRRDMMATLLAIGIDPQRVTLFHQDEVPEHAELGWYLTCLTPVALLRRQVAWKSKLSAVREEYRGIKDDPFVGSQVLLGLFSYPVLQSADILLYRASHVPVGEDQVQHLELSRDLATAFNRQHRTKYFPLPQHVLTPTKRVLSLRDPTQKMSKSAADNLSRILLTDSDDMIARKVARAVTDGDPELSYDPETRPAISNLLMLLSNIEPSKHTPDEWAVELNRRASELDSRPTSTGRLLKQCLTEATVDLIRPIRAEIERLQADPGYLQKIEVLGREKARQRAAETMQNVRQMCGLTSL